MKYFYRAYLKHPLGLMAFDNFFKCMNNFARDVRCSRQESFRLIIDNNESHLSIEVLEFAKENVVMTLRTTHRLQPQNRPVFGRLKSITDTPEKNQLKIEQEKPQIQSQKQRKCKIACCQGSYGQSQSTAPWCSSQLFQ